MTTSVSILICTKNRAESLCKTLESMAGLQVPSGFEVELLVIDNGSSDATSRICSDCKIPGIQMRYLHEPRGGKSQGFNTGLTAARGDIVLFTDDDVRVPPDWIAAMSGPILRGEADAVAGAVRIATHLHRPWMELYHRGWLGSTEQFSQADVLNMVGANMACSRKVFEWVPAFDPELGPGALGYHEEALFTWQLKLAGCRICFLPHPAVEHHFLETRLTRNAMLHLARSAGSSGAYLAHHWEHRLIRRPGMQWVRAKARLAYWRLRRLGLRRAHVCPRWEMEMEMTAAFLNSYRKERGRPRNYRAFGLQRNTPPSH